MSRKATNANLVGLRYAKALFSAQPSEEDISQFLQVSTLFVEDPLFKKMLDMQKICVTANDAIQEWIKSIAKELNFLPKVRNFLVLIASKGRLPFLHAISSSIVDINNINQRQHLVELRVFKQESDAEIAKIKNDIEKVLKINPILNVIIDPSIMGGYIVKTKSIMIDNSLKNRIKKIDNVMKGVA